jgi:hypothetical protein
MNEDLKQCLIAIALIAVAYSSIYLFYYVSKYFNYI